MEQEAHGPYGLLEKPTSLNKAISLSAFGSSKTSNVTASVHSIHYMYVITIPSMRGDPLLG